MKLIKAAVCAVALCLTAGPIWASTQTYYGGFEDSTGPSSDYDYNDLVFSISGSGLAINAAGGVWATEPVLNNSGTPFWNNVSSDPNHTIDNVGFCIYGGPAGACEGRSGVPLDSNAEYLATPTGGNVGDVFFTPGTGDTATVYLTITADTDKLGWALVGSPTVITYFTGALGSVQGFTPGGNFILVGNNGSTSYDSNSSAQFAFFAPAPEPSSLALLGTSLLGAAGAFRRKLFKK